MKKNPWVTLGLLIFAFGTLFIFLLGASSVGLFGPGSMKVVPKNAILHLELQGVIIDGKRFLKPLIKYRKEGRIKAVVVEVNSPGGVVGPSQEIYEEIRRTSKMGKPVVMVSSGLMASGAYYASAGADHVMVAPGALLGSIGVIMEFTNLEKLYQWAKVQRYSITTGRYKDSGAEYRQMREDERTLFQGMMNSVLGQFKDAIVKGRNLKPEHVSKYADGRIFTGAQAIELGFADSAGTLQDAYEKAAELAKLGENYEVFEAPKRRPGFWDLLLGGEEDEWSTESVSHLDQFVSSALKLGLTNQPLFLMPGTW